MSSTEKRRSQLGRRSRRTHSDLRLQEGLRHEVLSDQLQHLVAPVEDHEPEGGIIADKWHPMPPGLGEVSQLLQHVLLGPRSRPLTRGTGRVGPRAAGDHRSGFLDFGDLLRGSEQRQMQVGNQHGQVFPFFDQVGARVADVTIYNGGRGARRRCTAHRVLGLSRGSLIRGIGQRVEAFEQAEAPRVGPRQFPFSLKQKSAR